MAQFITFEGGEGSGKSLQAKRLFRELDYRAVPVLLTHEPGVTPLGRRIERWLKWGSGELSATAELMLFNASRAELVEGVIRPALQEGRTVICDRFYDSTTAYQGYGRGIDLDMVHSVNSAASQGLKPDLTVLLDIDSETGLERKRGRQDRFEAEVLEFHRRVRQGYLELASQEPGRWLVVGAAQSRGKIAAVIRQRVSVLLGGEPL